MCSSEESKNAELLAGGFTSGTSTHLLCKRILFVPVIAKGDLADRLAATLPTASIMASELGYTLVTRPMRLASSAGMVRAVKASSLAAP